MRSIKCVQCGTNFSEDDSNPNVHYSEPKKICGYCERFNNAPIGATFQNAKGEYYIKLSEAGFREETILMPWTIHTSPNLPLVLRHKHKMGQFMVTSITEKGATVGDSVGDFGFCDWKFILENFTKLDRSPCGIYSTVLKY